MTQTRFIAGIALIIGTVVILYLAILDPAPPRSPAPAAPTVATTKTRARATLIGSSGQVEVRRDNLAWTPLNTGDEVEPGADLRTGGDGRAQLFYREGVSFEVLPDTRVGLRDRGDVLRLVVSEGVAIADVEPASGARVELSNAKGDAVTEVSDGRVGVLVGALGELEAAVTRGRATLRAGGESVELQEGYRSTVQPGESPTPPSLLPRSLLLKVRWPERATSKRRQLVSGTTNPGARVRVGQTIVRADRRGRFEAVIELDEGVNTIAVFAVDAAGRDQRSSSPAIELDTRAPATSVKTDPSMWE